MRLYNTVYCLSKHILVVSRIESVDACLRVYHYGRYMVGIKLKEKKS